MAEVVEDHPSSAMSEVELEAAPTHDPPPVSAPPMQTLASLSEKPLLLTVTRTPRFHTPNFLTPLGSPIRRAIRMTKLDKHDAWLPLTESRNGNAYYSAFHTMCSGIGIQALVLPVAFTVLGW